MIKFRRFLFVFLALLAGIISPLKATHMMGGDMSYQCLGNGKYKITAKIYRDCRGIAFNSPDFGVFGGTNGGNGCGDYKIAITRTGIKDVTPRCSTASSPCTPTNSNFSGEGIEEHTYEVTVDFNTSPLNNFINKSSCCEVTFYIGQCCRNGAITTGAANNDFFTTAMINICNIKKTINKCNTSPQLSNPPIGFLCCNQAFYYNNGAIDTVDFDSFSYRLVSGIQSKPNNPVNYSSPFDARWFMTPYCVPPTTIKCPPNSRTNPPRGLFFDTSTGDIIITPTKCDEVAIAVIEMVEWRKDSATGKWIIIGRTRRDMQLIVRDDCGYNKAPTLGPQFNYKVCEGETLKFKVESDDETFTPFQTIPDTTSLKWNNGVPGAKFTIANKSDWPSKRKAFANFEWTPPIGSASDVSYSFTVTVSDNHCPKPSQAIRAFKIKVNPKPTAKRRYTQLKCGKFSMESYEIYSATNYTWSVRDSLSKELFYSSKKTDTMNYYYAGKYIIVHRLASAQSCVTIYRDTVYLTQPPKVILADADSFACKGTTFKLKAKVIAGKPLLKYKWNNGDTTDFTTIQNFKSDSTLMLEVTDGDGCKFKDTTLTYVKPLPVVNLGLDKVICTYETNTFDGQNNDTVKYLWSTGDTTRYMTTNLKGGYWVKITDTTFGCVKHDSAMLVVNDTVISNAGLNQAICDKDTFTLIANHRPSSLTPTYTWGGLGNLSTYRLKSDITKSTYMFTLKTVLTQNGRACEDLDTMIVKVKPLPKINWNSKPLKPQCYSYGSIWMEPFLVKPHNLGTYDIWNGDKFKKSGNITYGYTPYNGRFLFNTALLDNSKLQGGNNYTTKMYVRFTDTSGCSNLDSTTQTIYGTPLITLIPKTICQDIGSMMMDVLRTRPASKSGVYMKWDIVRAPSGIDTSKLLFNISSNSIPNIRFNFGAPSQDEYQGKYTFKLIVRDFVTGCQSEDTVDVNVIAEPNVNIKTIPDYCVNSGINISMFDYITVNGVKPTGGTIYIQDVNGDRTNPKVLTNISSGVFKISTGPGVYNIKYVSSQFGCTRIDSFNIIVHDTSDLKVKDTTICASLIPLDLLNLAVSNKGGTIVSYPDGRFFNGSTTATGYNPGPYKWLIVGLTQYNCQDTEYAKITIVNIPKLKFKRPIGGCELDTLSLDIDTQYLKGGTFSWQPITSFGPNMKRKYVPTVSDTALGHVDIRVDWVVPKNICPNAFDTVNIQLQKYPEIDFTFQNGCEPLSAIFVPTERKGINQSWLSYNWIINGVSSTINGPVPSQFSTQGNYWITLSVINNIGIKKCGAALTKSIEVYPKPNVTFTTDPLFKTTVALPKFKTINTTSVNQTPFFTTLQYNWTWGKSFSTGRDTIKSPSIIFGKDTGLYWIKLVATTNKGCRDSATNRVLIGPDIIIFVPDAFTPDGQGPNKNNTFIPEVVDHKTFSMTIFNRWGEKMYQTADLTKGWDGNYLGSPAQQGVYVYRIVVKSLEDKEYSYNGTFTLLR